MSQPDIHQPTPHTTEAVSRRLFAAGLVVLWHGIRGAVVGGLVGGILSAAIVTLPLGIEHLVSSADKIPVVELLQVGLIVGEPAGTMVGSGEYCRFCILPARETHQALEGHFGCRGMCGIGLSFRGIAAQVQRISRAVSSADYRGGFHRRRDRTGLRHVHNEKIRGQTQHPERRRDIVEYAGLDTGTPLVLRSRTSRIEGKRL